MQKALQCVRFQESSFHLYDFSIFLLGTDSLVKIDAESDLYRNMSQHYVINGASRFTFLYWRLIFDMLDEGAQLIILSGDLQKLGSVATYLQQVKCTCKPGNVSCLLIVFPKNEKRKTFNYIQKYWLLGRKSQDKNPRVFDYFSCTNIYLIAFQSCQ